MDTRSANLQVRFTESEMDQVKKWADEHGRSRSEFARERILAEPPLSAFFHDLIEGFSGIGKPYGWILERIIADYFARRTAYQHVWGVPMNLFEFAEHFDTSGESALEGERFVRWLQDVHTRDMVRERIEGLLRQENLYFPLPPHDAKFMVEHRAGRSWRESEQYAQKQSENAEREQILNEFEREHGSLPRARGEWLDAPSVESESGKSEGDNPDVVSGD